MNPVYSLKCGKCGTANNVSSSAKVVTWVCTNDGNVNMTSLPVALTGVLLIDYLQAKSILPPPLALLATNIVQAIGL